jgi:hypothetical protein
MVLGFTRVSNDNILFITIIDLVFLFFLCIFIKPFGPFNFLDAFYRGKASRSTSTI